MPQPLRVLILEDQPCDAQLIVSELRKAGFEPTWERVETEQEFLAKLNAAWDIILADYSLPPFDALQALRMLRKHKSQVPLIIVSGTIGEETAVAAMKEGAVDYLLKDRLGRLGPAVEHALEQRRTGQAQQRVEETLGERTHVILLTADVMLALNRAGTLREMLQPCTQSMVINLNVALARIWTLNAEQNVLELEASAGVDTHLDGLRARVPVGEGTIGLIAKQRAAHLTNDLLKDPCVSDLEWANREGMITFAGYPLMVEDRLVGVMALFARHRLTQAILDAMATAANQIAAGIERKRTEQNLRFTQFTIDHVATPVLWADAEGRFFNVNNAACRLTGYTREELLSRYVSDINSSIPRQNWPTVWSGLRQHGTLARENNLRRKDGTEISISFSSNLLKADGREFSCTFLQDITERKQAEEAQRQCELRFRAIFNQLRLQIDRMPLAYVLVDADLRVVDWNPAAEKIFGYRKGEVLGMGPPFERITPRACWSHVEDIVRRIRIGDMSAHSVNDNLTKDGRTITCEWINTPLEAEDGRFSGFMSLAHDVTERKRLEEQYRQGQKMEAIGQLAGGVAHDFNNLLTIILGYSEILQESIRDGDPLLELVEQIHTAGKRAARLTHQLLAFSRKQVLAPVILDLNTLLTDIEKMLARVIGEDIDLAFHPADDLWRVRVDPGQMEQILMNLVVNSRDAMPQGGRLTIETANVDLDETYAATHPGARLGEHVLLGVTDTGCGMDRATSARVFEPYFSTKGDQGTGLGLATVYGIVKQSGGHVTVYSEPGHGTSLKVYLPRDTEGVSAKRSPAESKAQRRGTETVLLVEDEEGVRTLARITLQRQGYKVLEARHGGEALLQCEQYQGIIDLLATDVVMPNMSGRELAERLLPLRRALKVLYMSGYMDDAIVRHGLLNSEVPFLQKPFTPDALAQKVREVLDRPATSLRNSRTSDSTEPPGKSPDESKDKAMQSMR